MDSRIPDFWLFHGLLRVCMSSKHGLLGGCLASGAFYAHSEMHAASREETDAHSAALQHEKS